jgi:hypothetical protein
MENLLEKHDGVATLLCMGCGLKYILTDTDENNFDKVQISPERNVYVGIMACDVTISISWCINCEKNVSPTCI